MEFDLAGLFLFDRQHPFAELGKRGTVFHGHELPDPQPNRRAPIQAQNRRPGQVDLQNPALPVQPEVADRGEINKSWYLSDNSCKVVRARSSSSFCISSSIWWTCSSWSTAQRSTSAMPAAVAASRLRRRCSAPGEGPWRGVCPNPSLFSRSWRFSRVPERTGIPKVRRRVGSGEPNDPPASGLSIYPAPAGLPQRGGDW